MYCGNDKCVLTMNEVRMFTCVLCLDYRRPLCVVGGTLLVIFQPRPSLRDIARFACHRLQTGYVAILLTLY